jgi:hypothetical protein
MFKMKMWELSGDLLDKLERHHRAQPDEWPQLIKEHDESVKAKELTSRELCSQMRQKSTRQGEINHQIAHLLQERGDMSYSSTSSMVTLSI